MNEISHPELNQSAAAATRQPDMTVDVVVVGAGFAGMYLLYHLRRNGFTAVALEAGDGVGGTWYWNRYPGARCDVESMQYSYQFSPELEQEWEWSERYATQPEILAYANHVADRYDLRRDIRFNTRVTSARRNDDDGTWTVTTDKDDVLVGGSVVLATGCLSSTNRPDFAGIDDFAGAIYHTGEWPRDGVDFTGKRVGIIGTGSSAIQSIPLIAEQAEELFVFQRTPNYAIPAHNRPHDPDYVATVKADYRAIRDQAKTQPAGIMLEMNNVSALEVDDATRTQMFEERWEKGGITFLGVFNDLMLNADANRTAADFVRSKIRDIVDDPATAELLSPSNIIGCKRLCVDTDYYKTFNRPNVHLVDVSGDAIERLTETGLRTEGGRTFAFDAIVFATGFDAMTGSIMRIDIRNGEGRSLADKWSEGPKTYLGLMTAEFPNLFMVNGPGSPSVLTNMLPSIEMHVEYITDMLTHLRERGLDRIEPTHEAEEGWVAHGDDIAGQSLRSTCSSWYVGANIPGKPRVFMPYIGGLPAYLAKCNDVAAKGYEGFQVG